MTPFDFDVKARELAQTWVPHNWDEAERDFAVALSDADRQGFERGIEAASKHIEEEWAQSLADYKKLNDASIQVTIERDRLRKALKKIAALEPDCEVTNYIRVAAREALKGTP